MTYQSNPISCSGITFKSVKQVKDALFRYGRFVNCVFESLDLYSLDLSHCEFDACNFKETRLGNCRSSKFYTCDLTGADATDANFAKCLAMNCRAEGLKMTGAIVSVDCNFFSGLITDRITDSAKLLYWTTQLENGFTREIREHLLKSVPPHVRAHLEVAFLRDPVE